MALQETKPFIQSCTPILIWGSKMLKVRWRQGEDDWTGGTKIKTNNNDFISISNPQMFASFLCLLCQMEISCPATAVKRNVGVGNCRNQSVCCFFWLSYSLHLSWKLLSLICAAQARLESSSMFIKRAGRCRFASATPPYNILGSSGNIPEKDACLWSPWSSVTCFTTANLWVRLRSSRLLKT